MDASQSALDSLRTVEFRETLKGYHRDDVDEYLEKAAVEAEGLQEQLRQSGERLRQAAERISELEAAAERQPDPVQAGPVVADDTLQRTLLLAQKFIDEAKADSEQQAARVIAEADAKARLLTEQAQAQAAQISAESEHRLRNDISRLEESRNRLSREVETMSRHLEGERNRLRTALGDILRWVDQNVQPTPTQDELRPSTEEASSPSNDAGAPQTSAVRGDSRTAVGDVGGPSTPTPHGSGPTGEANEMRPTGAMTTPVVSNAPSAR